ncbi:MAG: hypothetical protein R3C03_10985 [Pirellulaceae bacterium]
MRRLLDLWIRGTNEWSLLPQPRWFRLWKRLIDPSKNYLHSLIIVAMASKAIQRKILAALCQSGPRRFLLAPASVCPYPVPGMTQSVYHGGLIVAI